MTPPPTSIDGTDINGATIDGQEVQVITVDGDTVFTAEPQVPDPSDLQAHYDFSEESGSTPVTDQTGNGHDLSGSFRGVSRTINGVQAGEFDGHRLQTTFTNQSQPNTMAIVVQLDGGLSTQNEPFDNGTGFNLLTIQSGTQKIRLFAGSALSSNIDVDTDAHIYTVLFDGPNTILRLDGTQIASGDAGSEGLDGVTLGSRNTNENNIDGLIGECLVYNTDKSAIFTEIEDYLSEVWSITV